ncbi:MAG: CHASE2 domain-containing protein [Pseudobdellovibrionaceae bacterium]
MISIQRFWTFIITAAFFRLVWRRRGFYLRFLLCWLIGLLAFSTDEVNSYDMRFEFRGEQKPSQDIVIINVDATDFTKYYAPMTEDFKNIEEWTNITDGFFWSPKHWSQLLKKILKQNPRSVGITFNFSDNIKNSTEFQSELDLWKNPKVFWSTGNLENSNSVLQVGLVPLQKDDDGVIRRLIFDPENEGFLLAEKLTDKKFPTNKTALLLNYRGAKKAFTEYNMADILLDAVPSDALTNKIIIIGTSSTQPGFSNLTPLGLQSRAEIVAHITDNLWSERWVKRWPGWFYKLYLFILAFFTVYIIVNYPQPVALFFLLWTGTLLAALSAWVFDSFYVWLPALSPLILLFGTWIIFVGYLANKIERQNFRLQQEQQYLEEIEQLKNNFVSLISHDLKTPIAKIQAIVDRVIRQTTHTELIPDLKTLRQCSEELNRYIQSVLKLLRIEARDLKLNKEVADINEVIEQAIQQLLPLVKEKNQHLHFMPEPLFSLEFDITLIKEVVINLIENAIKYTPDAGNISIRTTETADFIQVHITDTGEGIPLEDQEKVWGKFNRGTGQDMKTKGTGLGLYLVKYFVELHGGQVHLASQLKKGTTVSFSLPLDNHVDNQDPPSSGEEAS